MSDWYENIDEKDKITKQLAESKSQEETIRIIYNNHPLGYSNIEPIKTLEEYFRYIRITTTDFAWFRGESREHENFIPKLFRNIKDDKIDEQLDKEKHFFFEFKRKAKSMINNIADDDYWLWYFLIQHYGGPTRLFDWTTDASVALFMALDTSREKTDNPVVFTLQPAVLTSYAFKELGKEIKGNPHIIYPGEDDSNRWIGNILKTDEPIPESPIALLPAYADPRIVSQRSCFTLFGRRIDGFKKDGKELLCDCCKRRIRHRIIIDGTKKNELRKELVKIGVTSGRVYPGIEGLIKELYQEIYKQET